MTFCGTIGRVSEIGRFSLEWRIPDFLSKVDKGGDGYESPVFESCGGQWVFVTRPNGFWNHNPSGSVHLYLLRLDGGPSLTLHVTAGIRGTEGVEKRKGKSHTFAPDDPACFWYTFCSRSELRERESRLMPGKALTISLETEVDVPRIPSDSSTQTEEESELPTVSPEKQGIEKLSEDMGRLLVSQEDSDLTVQVGGEAFRVHRSVLSARSPVLCAMFRHDTEERASNRITVRDCGSDVFGDFLDYLYRGSARRLSPENAFELYRVADKYLAEDLKQQCLAHVRNSLCLDTFCEAMQLALTYGERGLLQQAMEFASENIRSIIRSVQWQHFNRDHPEQATEILIKSLGPPN